MSKLTFGVEMELFIKQTVSLHKLIIKEIEINGFTTFQELLTFIISKTTYNPDKFIIDNNTPFINNIDNKTYNICILKPDDYYVIILIITYIICKNNKDTISFSLLKYVDCVDDNNIIYFKDYKNKLNWYYDLDFSLFILKNENDWDLIQLNELLYNLIENYLFAKSKEYFQKKKIEFVNMSSSKDVK
jgi:hypothetical protein